MVDVAEVHLKCVELVTAVAASAGWSRTAAAGIVKFTSTAAVSGCTNCDVPPLSELTANSEEPPAAAIRGKVASTVVVVVVCHSAACVVPNCCMSEIDGLG